MKNPNNSQPKKVGIIGGAGFIGSYNTSKFLAEGYSIKVSVTDLAKPEKYNHLKQLPHSKNLEIVELDVRNEIQLKPLSYQKLKTK